MQGTSYIFTQRADTPNTFPATETRNRSISDRRSWLAVCLSLCVLMRSLQACWTHSHLHTAKRSFL